MRRAVATRPRRVATAAPAPGNPAQAGVFHWRPGSFTPRACAAAAGSRPGGGAPFAPRAKGAIRRRLDRPAGATLPPDPAWPLQSRLFPAPRRARAPMTVQPSVLSLIGQTPIVQAQHLDTGVCELYLKLECMNPGGSIK